MIAIQIYIYIYIIFKYIYKYIYLASIFLHNIFLVIFKSQVLTLVIYILLVTISKLSVGVDNIHQIIAQNMFQ